MSSDNYLQGCLFISSNGSRWLHLWRKKEQKEWKWLGFSEIKI